MSAYLGALFLASAIASCSIWASWNRYLPSARQQWRQIAAGPASRELRFTIINVEVERASAVIHRPVFTPQSVTPRRPASLRAA
jgi:hypothetical protein